MLFAEFGGEKAPLVVMSVFRFQVSTVNSSCVWKLDPSGAFRWKRE